MTYSLQDYDKFSALLLSASDSQLDASMKPLIQKWDSPPQAIQVLEVLDHCIHAALASGVVIQTLHIIYNERLDAEGTTHEQVVPLATWRNR